MAFSFLTPENIRQKYIEAKDAFAVNYSKFNEYERLADNEPGDVEDGMPDGTDGTTASFLDTRPKSTVQRVPSVKVKLSGSEKLEEIFDELANNVIIPNATTGGSVRNKSISSVRKSMTYGSQPSLIFVKDDGTYFGADFQLVNIRDVTFEPGKTSDSSCNYMFLDAWYTKSDIDDLIETEKELAKDEDYETDWDVVKLDEMKTRLVSKDLENKTKAEAEVGTGDDLDYVHIVHGFQKGIGNMFFAFDPEGGEDCIVRQWINPDPRGLIPIHLHYNEQDGERALGVSAIALTAPMQNVMDRFLQNWQFQVGIKAAPPIKARGGSIDIESLKYLPYAIWDMGSDANSDASPVNTDDTLINSFPTVQGILKGNLLNLTNNGDTSVSATVGNPGFSKTHAGVRAQMERIDTADNYLRGQYEDWFGRVIETMLNLHIAAHVEMGDREVVPLSERYIESKKRANPEYDLTEEEIDYKQLAGVTAKVKVDASSSKIDNDAKQVEIMTGLLEAKEVIEPYVNMGALVKQFIKKSGVENVDEIVLDEAGIAEQQQTAQEGEMMPESEELVELPASPPEEQPLPMDEALIEGDLVEQLRANGLSEPAIAEAIAALESGVDPSLIDDALRSGR